MPLYLSESDVEGLLSPAEAVPVLEACFGRLAAGAVENVPRRRLALEQGYFAIMAAVDSELGYAGLKSYTVTGGRLAFVVCLFSLSDGKLAAVIEADALGQRRTGAASGVAAKQLARAGASTLGVIGCGWQAESQLAAIRAAVPSIERAVAFCRTPERLAEFCAKTGAEPAASPQEAAAHDIVVTATTSKRSRAPRRVAPGGRSRLRDRRQRSPRPRARRRRPRTGDVRLLRLARAGEARVGRPDRAGCARGDRLARGVRAAGCRRRRSVSGRGAESDIAVFKSNGLAAWDVAAGVAVLERARERGVGRDGLDALARARRRCRRRGP